MDFLRALFTINGLVTILFMAFFMLSPVILVWAWEQDYERTKRKREEEEKRERLEKRRKGREIAYGSI